MLNPHKIDFLLFRLLLFLKLYNFESNKINGMEIYKLEPGEFEIDMFTLICLTQTPIDF